MTYSAKAPTRYNSQRSERGYALLVCNENFKSKELSTPTEESQLADVEALKELLEQQFQFVVDLEADQTAAEMITSVKQGKLV